jgi:hypothetical protein
MGRLPNMGRIPETPEHPEYITIIYTGKYTGVMLRAERQQ